MIPPDHRDRRTTTGDYGPTKAPRGVSDSDVHTTTPRLEPISGAPEWVRLLQAQQAQSEGRLMAEIFAVEKRIEVRKESRELAEMSAQLTTTTRSLERTRRVRKGLTWATVTSTAGGAMAIVALLARACGQPEIAEAARQVAAETAELTAEQKAAELERKHAATSELARETSGRVEKLEEKLDRVLELLERPTTIEVPPATSTKGRRTR